MSKKSLFIGHGSPLNALATHEPAHAWQSALRSCGQRILTECRAILVVSAHWQTRGTEIFATTPPHTIHDFIGFPDSLYSIQYPAPGAVTQAQDLARSLNQLGFTANFSQDWGYDHGVWGPLVHLAPEATIPVFMVSLDRFKSPEEHFALANAIGRLLGDDVVVVGSGNIVHSLTAAAERVDATPPDWAVNFDKTVAERLVAGDTQFLTKISRDRESSDFACVPTLDHYLPLIYTAAIAGPEAHVTFPFTGFQNGTISMRCALFEPQESSANQ